MSIRLRCANQFWREWSGGLRLCEWVPDSESLQLEWWEGIVVRRAVPMSVRREALREEVSVDWAEFSLNELDSHDAIGSVGSVSDLLSWMLGVRKEWSRNWEEIGVGKKLMVQCYGHLTPVIHGGIRCYVRRERRHLSNPRKSDGASALWEIHGQA